MRKYLVAVAMLAALGMPASAQLNSQQQRMKDCNIQATEMGGDARKQFMSSFSAAERLRQRSLIASTASRAAIPASPRTRFATNSWELGVALITV